MKMATGQSEVMSDEIINIKCSVCSNQGKTRDAEKYCEQCKDYYCTSCVDIHKMLPALRQHNLLDKSAYRNLEPNTFGLPSFPTQKCVLHPNKVVEMYCRDHDEVACPPCIAINHRSCKSICCIPDEVELFDTMTFNAKKQKINLLRKTMEQIKKDNQARIEELHAALDKEIESVKAFTRELQNILNNMETETINQLRKEYSEFEIKLVKETQEFEVLIDKLSETESQVKRSEGNVAEEFVTIKLAEKVTVKAEETNLTWKRNPKEYIRFTADYAISNYLEPIKQLGKVNIYPKATLYDVTKQTEINVKLPSDKLKCNIYDSCITDNGFLLLVDDSNNKLKRMNISTDITMKDYLELPGSLRCVCQVSKEEVAVAIFEQKTVEIISLSEKMSVIRSLKMNHKCLGIAYYSGKLFITDNGSKVYIHDMDGRELCCVPTLPSVKIFDKPRHIYVDPVNNKIYVADGENKIVILDQDGNYMSNLKLWQVNFCCDVCTYGRGIFVCGSNSSNIVQIGEDHKVLGKVAELKCPRSVCFDLERTRLIVTHQSSDTITILQLC